MARGGVGELGRRGKTWEQGKLFVFLFPVGLVLISTQRKDALACYLG